MKTLDNLFTQIAQEHLNVETLEERFSDGLDFHDCGVVGIKHALQAAYQAGVNSKCAVVPEYVSVRFARKPASFDEVKSVARDMQDTSYRCQISETVEMTTQEYDIFSNSLMSRRSWLAGKGGFKNGHLQAIAVTAPDRATLYVNPEGSDYGRYVGMEVPKLNFSTTN